jgi:hypothetical protein
MLDSVAHPPKKIFMLAPISLTATFAPCRNECEVRAKPSEGQTLMFLKTSCTLLLKVSARQVASFFSVVDRPTIRRGLVVRSHS